MRYGILFHGDPNWYEINNAAHYLSPRKDHNSSYTSQPWREITNITAFNFSECYSTYNPVEPYNYITQRLNKNVLGESSLHNIFQSHFFEETNPTFNGYNIPNNRPNYFENQNRNTLLHTFLNLRITQFALSSDSLYALCTSQTLAINIVQYLLEMEPNPESTNAFSIMALTLAGPLAYNSYVNNIRVNEPRHSVAQSLQMMMNAVTQILQNISQENSQQLNAQAQEEKQDQQEVRRNMSCTQRALGYLSYAGRTSVRIGQTFFRIATQPFFAFMSEKTGIIIVLCKIRIEIKIGSRDRNIGWSYTPNLRNSRSRDQVAG